ncbi:TPA: hypothetical protein PFE16_004293 [Kluyvera georgiana]|uniref:hypothetical protein n=1 Tax=Kluyvera georgiana TaxID=73098 RepID=UPI002302B74F|nr:hypothetical protein [Kluyvera georgiana]MDA8493234.1 hypothetical protein [Kluyvera georgiana]HDG1692766.1 hypothetical protein [Kluyvera georgiana]
MGVIKKAMLGIFILMSVLSLFREFQDFGFKIGLVLSVLLLLSTAFLWQWASGWLPQMGKLHAVMVMMALTLVFLGTIDYAMADSFNVDLLEVIRTTIKHSPWFYVATFIGSGIKVFFWHWLFSGVRQKNAEHTAAG